MTTWSYSALRDFEGCARRYHVVRILKAVKSPKTEQILYGEELHKACEEYVKNDAAIPPKFKFVQRMVDALLTKPGKKLAEYKMGVREDGSPCDFFDKTVWMRGVADLLIIDEERGVAYVVDYKTGKDRYPDYDQLELMSLAVMAHFPTIDTVHSALLFVVRNNMLKSKITRADADALWWKYRQRVARLEQSIANNVWNPTQSPLCRFCPCSAQCELHPDH